jgi:hypothetical protein
LVNIKKENQDWDDLFALSEFYWNANKKVGQARTDDSNLEFWKSVKLYHHARLTCSDIRQI